MADQAKTNRFLLVFFGTVIVAILLAILVTKNTNNSTSLSNGATTPSDPNSFTNSLGAGNSDTQLYVKVPGYIDVPLTMGVYEMRPLGPYATDQIQMNNPLYVVDSICAAATVNNESLNTAEDDFFKGFDRDHPGELVGQFPTAEDFNNFYRALIQSVDSGPCMSSRVG